MEEVKRSQAPAAIEPDKRIIVQATKEKKIYISNQEIKQHGCISCIWKMHKICPSGLTGDQVLPAGICEEYMQFLLSFADGVGTVSEMWEKFHIYIARIQSLDDYQKFLNASKELEEVLQESDDPTEIAKAKIKVNTYRIWWQELSKQVMTALSRTVDREQKAVSDQQGQMNVQQMAQLMAQNRQKLLDIEAKRVVDDGTGTP